jgi:molybdate transport system permease protein
MRSAFGALLVAALALAVAFLLLPLVAIFAQVSPGTLAAQARSSAFTDALLVSAKTSVIAHAFVLAVATPAAYLLATRRFRGRSALLGVLELPLVLPPAVAGIGLLYTFGRSGLLGGTLDALGVRLTFTQAAVVLAIVFVSSPFYLRTAVAAFEAVDPQLLEAARTLGAGSAHRFRRVALPLAAGGLAAGSSLAWARGLGEFGATLMFAGSFQGVTQTLPLAIYAQLYQGGDPSVALAIGGLLVLVSVLVLSVVRLLPRWNRFTSTSLIPFARSSSA